MKALLYCTKAKPRLIKGKHEFYTTDVRKDFITPFQFENTLNGYIVAECDIDKVEEIKLFFCENVEEFEKQSCLTMKQVVEYTGDFNKGYALHLSNVKAFDELKDMNSFYANHCIDKYGITSCDMLMKAPQNMMNVCNSQGNRYVLISIQPQWLCKILNGEKTIEVRKQILNCLKEMVE